MIKSEGQDPANKVCFIGELKSILKQTRNWNLLLFITTIKLLLIPSYFSTDFEVHRNWLAITSSLPISKWYFENTSEWTLDYPPFFAWFEFTLSKAAYYFDKGMLEINNLNYSTIQTILFQRFSVIFSDLLFIIATLLLSNLIYSNISNNNKNNKSSSQSLAWYQDKSFLVSLIVILNPGLLMVDHIHFQYNGFLKGILILSMYFIIRGNILVGSVLFCVLLNFKHIYMYMAPAYFVYLLIYYCFENKKNNKFSISNINIFNFIKLGSSVLFIFALSLGPFIAMGQIPQLLSRLFPFGRGLSHAYWAPNFWSLYNFLDRILLFNGLYKKIPFFKDLIISSDVSGNLTSGLVGSDSQTHAILPKITPPITLLITVLFLIPSIYGIIKSKNWKDFILGICQSSFTFFMFGWHVHEKAIIMITIPLGFLSLASNNRFSKLYFILSTVGHYSLFPLLFKPTEITTRILVLAFYTILLYLSIISTNQQSQSKKQNNNNGLGLYFYEIVYLIGLIGLEIFNIFIHPFYLAHIEKYSFIALMITSVYTSIGIHYCYLYIFKLIFSKD
ncbi:hypothetical protein DICPUDRAFT_38502 [Dictyostelium purpureum]|uniref:Alpha-1,3-glucosyltransferase n=1 Tax=Dictyostelium purpureum TaxID=5786 RepID=F0ZUK5_DICPU|nr:uncharacterized protein DICPUDRAFT_38502 [Dictyostelium purpureum]EGC32375.1 hypothetical protein DICPUDRAFT_38502 [Dictyostelium purpureum]|eukprot:XP_003291105.1 hypothetical protein DICPUDRAFT_38502 [Dictyostelium purpureum]